MQKIFPQQIYKDFKGRLYQILTLAEYTKTEQVFVIYQALYGEFKVYAQPYSEFISKVDKEKYPEAFQQYYFELQPVSSVSVIKEEKDSFFMEDLKKQNKDEIFIKEKKNFSEIEDLKKQNEDEIFIKEKKSFSEMEDLKKENEEELQLDPLVLQFLDADSYEQRLNILAGLHHRITDDMITTMSIACDLEVGEGELEERYENLKNCLLMMQRYECNRLR